MRALLLPASYAPVLGGLQTATRQLACHLNSVGHEVRVVTNRFPRSLREREVMDGIAVQRLHFLYPTWSHLTRKRPDLALAGLLFLPATSLRLSSIIREFRPTVLNIHYPQSQNPFVLWMRRTLKFRLVVSLHGYEIEGYAKAGRTEQWLLRSMLRAADAVTACSQSLLDKAIALDQAIADKCSVIPNGVDLSRFRNAPAHRHHKQYLLALGRLTHQKGFDLLLQALARASMQPNEPDLILAGEGEEAAALRKQAVTLGLGKRVHLIGRASPEQVVSLLNGCECVIVPSIREPFGIVALEAMASGKPIVASRVGGLPEFIDDEVNWLVAPTVDGLASGLTECWKRQQEFAARGARNRAKAAGFDWSDICRRFETVLEGAPCEL